MKVKVKSGNDSTRNDDKDFTLNDPKVEFQNIVENIPTGVYRSTPDGKLLAANPALVRILGYDSLDELLQVKIGRDLFVDPAERLKYNELLNLSDQVQNVELHLRRKDGREIIVLDSSRVIRDENDRILYYEGSLTDITERRAAERALEESEAKYRSLFDHAVDGIYRIAEDGRLLAANPALVRMIGYASEEELLSTNVSDWFFSQEDAERIIRLLGETGELNNVESILKRKDGRLIVVRNNTRVVRDPKGKILFFEGTLADITKQAHAEENFRNLLEVAPDAIVVSNSSGKIVLVNSQLEKMFGYARSELMGQSLEILLPERFRNGHSVLRAEYLRKPRIRTHTGFELYGLRRDRSEFPTEINLGPLKTPDDMLVFASIRDITKRKEAEEALQESEELFRSVMDHSAIGIALSAPDGHWLRVNKALCDMLGYSAQELLQSNFQSMTHPDDLEIGLQQMRQLLAGEQESCHLEKRYIHKSGRSVWASLSLSLVRHPHGEPRFFIAQVQDITERKQAEQILVESEERYRSIFEQSAVGVSQIDLDGKYAKVNQKFCELVGYSREELLRMSFTDITFPDDLEEDMQRNQDLLAGRIQSFVGQKRYVRKDGSLIWVEMTVNLLHDVDGKARYLNAIINDVSPRKQAADALERRAEEFKALVQAGESLTSTLELQPLLENILMAAQRAIPAGEKGTVLLWDEHAKILRVWAQSGYRDSRLMELPFKEDQGYSSVAFHQKRSLLIRDAAEEYVVPFNETLDEVNSVQSGIVTPLTVKGKVIGVIALDNSTRKNAFTEDDLRLMEAFALQAAAAIENARLYEETQRRAAELSSLTRVSSALRSAATRLQMFPVILDQLMDVLPADGAMIGLIEPSTRDISIELGRGNLAGLTDEVIPSGNAITDNLMITRRPYVVADVREDARANYFESLKEIRAVAAVPLIAQDRVVGVLWADRREAPNGSLPDPFSERDVHLLLAINDIAANAIHRASLHEQTVLHAEQMAGIGELGRLLAETVDVQTLYRHLTGSIYALLSDICGVFVFLYDSERQSINCVSAHYDGNFLDASALPVIAYSADDPDKRTQAIDTRRAQVLDDLQPDDEAWFVQFLADQHKTPRSALYIPLLTVGKVIGLLEVHSYLQARFDTSDVELLTLVANTAAVEIQNTRMLQQFEHNVQRLTALHAIDSAINSSTDLRLSLRIALEHTIRLLEVDAASVLVLNPVTLNLDFVAGTGFRSGRVSRNSVRLGEGLAGKAALQRAPIQASDLSAISSGFPQKQLVELEKFQSYMAVPLISKGKVSGVLELFHRGTLEPNQEWFDFLNILADQVALAVDNAYLYEGLERANVELTMAYDATIEGWSSALDLRDKETEGHTQRVTDLTLRLAQSMGVPDYQIPYIRRGALLHDIGKIGVPDYILRKPSSLTDEEWEIMRQHPRLAYELLSPIAYLRPALDIPYSHHEKWDGSGYPQGLKGEQIPLMARMFAVADVYDALTSDRPYRPAWTHEKALAYIREQAGHHFDPHIAEVFLLMIEEQDSDGGLL